MLLNTREAAKMLRISTCTLARWVKQGIIPATIIPNQGQGKRPTYRFQESVILAILEGNDKNDECTF